MELLRNTLYVIAFGWLYAAVAMCARIGLGWLEQNFLPNCRLWTDWFLAGGTWLWPAVVFFVPIKAALWGTTFRDPITRRLTRKRPPSEQVKQMIDKHLAKRKAEADGTD